MGLLKNLLPVVGAYIAVVGVFLVVAPHETVKIVYGGKVLPGSLLGWTTRGSFEFGYGMLAVFSRNWWGGCSFLYLSLSHARVHCLFLSNFLPLTPSLRRCVLETFVLVDKQAKRENTTGVGGVSFSLTSKCVAGNGGHFPSGQRGALQNWSRLRDSLRQRHLRHLQPRRVQRLAPIRSHASALRRHRPPLRLAGGVCGSFADEAHSCAC